MQHSHQIFKTKVFSRWARKHGINFEILMKAVVEMENGLIEANLGSNLYKKRIAIQGHGKRGGARTLVATNLGNRWIFLFGFTKNERDNISSTDLVFWKNIAHDLLSMGQDRLKALSKSGKLVEVKDED